MAEGTYEIFALLGCYAAQIGRYLPAFWDNLSVPTSKVKIALCLEMVPGGCPETSVNNVLPQH